MAQLSRPGQTPEPCCWQNRLVNVNMTAAVQQGRGGYLFAYHAQRLDSRAEGGSAPPHTRLSDRDTVNGST